MVCIFNLFFFVSVNFYHVLKTKQQSKKVDRLRKTKDLTVSKGKRRKSARNHRSSWNTTEIIAPVKSIPGQFVMSTKMRARLASRSKSDDSDASSDNESTNDSIGKCLDFVKLIFD